MRSPLAAALSAIVVLGLAPDAADAQSLGTFRWQLQPYCNLLTVVVTQVGSVYRVEGTDDQCGAATSASVVGTAFLNPNGSIGFGLNVVAAPSGIAAPIDATIAVATLSGTWRDGGGGSGTFTFTPGAGTGGSSRPAPTAAVPAAIRLLTDGGLLAGGQLDLGTIPATGPGVRMMWYPGKAAFRAGHVGGTQWNDASIGGYSVALGIDTVASGEASTALGLATSATGYGSTALGGGTGASGELSTAMGFITTASGSTSTAMGRQTQASGYSSTAMGESTRAMADSSTAIGIMTTASGFASTAMGHQTLASGSAATAIGTGTRAAGLHSLAGGFGSQANGAASIALGIQSFANGDFSVALGNNAVTTPAALGSFVFADNSGNAFASFAPNEFVVRAAGGIGLYTNAASTSGAEMAPGGGSWAALSDANMKENFREVSGEEVLAKLAAIPVREWNYTSQDASIRHMGPTAQDFRAAFGLGDFPLRINTIDADGVALAGVKALDHRTSALRQAMDELRLENADLRARLARLEAVLDGK